MKPGLGAVLALLFATGCAAPPTHSLQPRTPSRAKKPCRIAVGPVADRSGLDHAVTLRDELSRSGPCSTVSLEEKTGEPADLTVRGRVDTGYSLGPDKNGLGVAGQIVTIAGGSLSLSFAIPYVMLSALNDGDRDIESLRSTFGTVSLISGVVMLGGIAMWVAGDAGRGGESQGWITTTGTLTTRDGRTREYHIRNDVFFEPYQLPNRAHQFGAAYRRGMAPVLQQLSIEAGDALDAR
jgi:hypothetical protein